MAEWQLLFLHNLEFHLDALHPNLFPPEFKILYELITIYDLVDKFFDPGSVKAAREVEE